MWIFTTFGFFSAVEHRNDSQALWVRGRIKSDIEKLARTLYGDGAEDMVEDTPQADYPCRVLVSKIEFSDFIGQEIRSINYDNYKNVVGEKQGKGRANVYSSIWSAMRNLKWVI